MKIHTMPQGDPQWHAIRAKNFTASELGEWVLEPVKVTLTVTEIQDELSRLGIPFTSKATKPVLLSLLPDPDKYAKLCDGAKTAVLRKIKQAKLARMRATAIDGMTTDELLYLEREDDLQAQSDRAFQYNIPVKYGKLLEPFARSFYESRTGYEVTEVGFVEHGDGTSGFGCSPDGLVSSTKSSPWTHGIELKCPIPETHLAWLDDRDENGNVRLPDCHRLQVHMSMVCCGVDRWDFVSYCPGEVPILIQVFRDETTDQLERGLRIIVEEKRKMQAKLSEWHRAEYGKGEA